MQAIKNVFFAPFGISTNRNLKTRVFNFRQFLTNVFFILLFSTMTAAFSGCYYDKEELLYGNSGTINCATISAKFSTDVKPIIQSKCATAGCHDAASASGGAVLETYTQIAAQSARINQRCVVEKNMPTTGPLPPAEIAAIKCWIDSGAPNN
jgi:uncharacterized membrane protein